LGAGTSQLLIVKRKAHAAYGLLDKQEKMVADLRKLEMI
jgi:hypothetical protein